MLTVKMFTFNPIQENTYVVYNDQLDCAIVDPGCYFADENDELKQFIDKKGLQVKYLLNTHGHLDHVFGDQFVFDTWGLQPHLHETEKQVFDYAPVSALRYNLPFKAYTGSCIFLREGDTIRLGEDNLKVLFTPGHSPGHISYWCEAQHFVLSGDVLFRQSIGRTDLPGGDYETLLNSIRSELFVMPDDTLVYSGHGPSTTIGYEKRNNPFFNR
ncbi:MBL fold metallo-hydrolase [Pseudoflavitalea sp. G-6-1-2]|uniref:MBL fold metallo-hydrolase n=1 Tax=Pseudoflavitalea sp. G-6-1-2 TaxID=2728841 RepID=UPI00146C50DD|nr:MBL fold metallo-hydrolase [Pseudoflavitalea sp. G-6-1-2]NML20484.1 MBL fold metallo-hydrolase [Pseudoflavitalea sp. G-6-1-2]